MTLFIPFGIENRNNKKKFLQIDRRKYLWKKSKQGLLEHNTVVATASMVIGTGFLCLNNYQSSKTNKLSSINAGTVVDTKTVPFSEILTSYTTCTGNVTLELVNDPTFYSGNF